MRWRRLRHWCHHALTPVLGRLGDPRVDGKLRWMRFVPLLPQTLQRYAPIRVWPAPRSGTDPSLRTVPGNARDPEAERRAFEEAPLHDFMRTHTEAVSYSRKRGWDFILPTAPRLLRSHFAVARAAASTPEPVPAVRPPEEVTRLVREEATRLKLSAVGFARYDPKYTFAEYAEGADDNVIVCIVEQDFAATQTAPSGRAERAAFRAYAEVMERAAALAVHLQSLGYRARPQTYAGQGVAIHYGVEAGLGQLGLNGQLLTPQAGSRARLVLITTNAPIVPGEPVDFGVHAICDQCQLCVRRCPVGAIPKARKPHRGVVKAKIKSERCFPIMVQTHGCAVCMKVCPVQRYGIDAVADHLVETGTVLGKGTDELEGYPWPLDGEFYGAGEKPRIDGRDVLHPPGWIFDGSRKGPLEPTA